MRRQRRIPRCSQHHAVGQQGRRVLTARGVEAARGRPGPARRVVQFRARQSIVVIKSRCSKHHAVGQQGRRVLAARGVEAARGRPCPVRRVVQFRASEREGMAGSPCNDLITPCNQHHAVGQQGRRVTMACGVEAARGRPGPARWVVQFRARKSAASGGNPPATSTIPLGSKVAV